MKPFLFGAAAGCLFLAAEYGYRIGYEDGKRVGRIQGMAIGASLVMKQRQQQRQKMPGAVD